MNYIDPVEYSKLIKAFTQGATKQTLVEGIEEKKELSTKQKNIAKQTPPEDEINPEDFKALQAKKAAKKEGLHRGMANTHDFSKLSVDDRKQLKEYIGSLKEIKKAIKELMGKASMEEGGDTTGKFLPEIGDDDVNVLGAEDAEYDRMQAAHDMAREKGFSDEDEEDDTILSKIIRQKGEEDAIAGSIY
jgi:hypothetical protein